MSAEFLTPKESVRLCELERVIQKGKDTFVEVGNALAEIRDSRMYRGPFKTFEDYCQKRWGFTRNYVNRIIAAAEVTSNLVPMGTTPESERQARPLAKLPAEKQPEAWSKAQEKAKEEGKPVAARHVEAAVAEVVEDDEPETLIEDGTKTMPRVVIRQSSGLDTVATAINIMDTISKTDEHREAALNRMIQYCQNRIQTKK